MGTIIVDQTTGQLTVEGVDAGQLRDVAGDLLGEPAMVNCGRPLDVMQLSADDEGLGPRVWVHSIYHGSVVEGPGRRSVLQVQGCPIRCPGCYVPQTHNMTDGVLLSLDAIELALLSRDGAEPRDGVTILGGEPFAQPFAMAELVRRLKARGVHVLVYTGYVLDDLLTSQNEDIQSVLGSIDMLIDGPFKRDLTEGAGEWRGSTNQRLLYNWSGSWVEAGKAAVGVNDG